MPLEKCPKCGQTISSHTHSCIYCGFVKSVLEDDLITCPNCGTPSSHYICEVCNFDIGNYYFEKGCDIVNQNRSAFRSVYSAGKEDESLRNMLISAKLGYPDALNMLGVCYKNGIAVKKDEERGFEYLLKAAMTDLSEAEFNVACCYELGIGTDIDYFEALKWYKKAARHYNEDAIFNIGNFYMQGLGVEPDYEQAIEWFSKLDEQDYEAQYCIGICYLNLGLTNQNLSYAESHFKKALKGNIPDAKEKLDLIKNVLRK